MDTVLKDLSQFPDYTNPDFVADPYPYYAQLRHDAPVYWSDSHQAWYLTRHADVEAVARNRSVSSSRVPAIMSQVPQEQRDEFEPFAHAVASWMLFIDPPDHTRLRGLVNKAFTPRMIGGLREQIQRIIDDLLDRVTPKAAMDVISDFALPLPATVISTMLGVQPEGQDQFKQWSDDIVMAFSGHADPVDRFRRGQQSLFELADYFRPFVTRLRHDPQDDIMGALVMAEEAGDQLTEEELFANCVLLLVAGHETTTNLIGNGLLALLRHPRQFALLREEPALIRSAVEELLRYDSPAQNFSRLALEDIEVGGTTIRQGDRIFLCYGAANRDPEQFEHPDQLDIRRPVNHHVAFSNGIHYCLGAALARLEGQLALQALVERMPKMTLTAEPVEWNSNLSLRGVKALHVTF